MDRRLELAEALMDLSRASERVAKLLTTAPIEFTTDKITEALATRNVKLDPWSYQNWPSAPAPTRSVPDEDRFVGTNVLEWAMGGLPAVTVGWSHAREIFIVTNKYHQPGPNTKIVDGPGAGRYDVGVIWESLEFSDDPLGVLLMFKKHCKLVYVRFRPWTSYDGAYLNHPDRVYYHLATEVANDVRWKVVRPLAEYDRLIRDVGMSVRERRINTRQMEPFFKTNPEVMDTICARTWGTIDRDQAVRIMMTDSVDYVLG